jgi:O-methyltransferase
MSLHHQIKRTKRTLTHALAVNYGRYMQYSPTIDRINRRPLLQNFALKNSNAPSFPTREAMWSFIAARDSAPIDYLEFGVHQGHSILYFADKNKTAASRFFGFDCFTGLPEDWNSDFRRGHFDTGGRIPKTDDVRVKFVVGMFQDTLPRFLADFKTSNRIVVNIDCDLYSSVLYCLTRLDTVLPKGTILIFDEFGEVLHEFRAANDYVASYRREFKVLCSHDDFYTVAVELL